MARVPRILEGGNETEGKSHFCPGCGTRLIHFQRYPWYFCGACLARAEDGEGRKLTFFNSSISGGLGWRYEDDSTTADLKSIAVVCHIDQRPVLVSEARFGGVVAQPLTSSLNDAAALDMQANLTEGEALRQARE